MSARATPARAAARPDAAAPPAGEALSFGSYDALLRRQKGATRLMIALTGVGNPSKPFSGFDFSDALARLPGTDSLLLRDRARSWWQAVEGREALLAHCRAVLRQGGYRGVATLGISMGAFGALWLGEALPEARVLALAPPYSVDTQRHGRFIVRYKRWLDAQPEGAGAGTDQRPGGDPARYLLLFGDEEPIDLANAELFRQAGWPGLFLLPGGAHNLGHLLKRSNALGRMLALLAGDAPMAAVAGAAGALALHPHGHGPAMLRARRLLYEGDAEGADPWLADAAAAVGAGSPPLSRLRWLRAGLERDLAALRGLDRAALARRSLALGQGAELEFESSTAWAPNSSADGLPLALGPLAFGRLRWPGGARAVLRLRAEAPARPNAAGHLALAGFVPEGSAGWRVLGVAQQPVDPLTLRLDLQQGEARFLLRRRCFSSGFDALRTEDQLTWAMRLRGVELEAAPG